jgi:sporulation protein YlmC with PRC-barrel domain
MWFECAVTSNVGLTANQIYSNMFPTEQVSSMPDSGKFVPLQQFIGLQVIDTKGSLIGNVKDISIDFTNKAISLKVSTKSKGEMDFGWDDLQSVEDVVLLKRQVDLSSISKGTEGNASEMGLRGVQTSMICPNCGSSAPARAKFCSKCGADLKS